MLQVITATRQDFEVKPAPLADVRSLVKEHHYARSCSNTAVTVTGIYRRLTGELVGGALWMPPTKPAAASIDPVEWRRVLCLSRVVLIPGLPKNAAGMLVGGSIRQVKRDSRWLWALTYADEAEGHTGHLYKVTNWEYVGRTSPEKYWVLGGVRVSQLSTKTRTTQTMRDMGCEQKLSPGKHKFKLKLRTS